MYKILFSVLAIFLSTVVLAGCTQKTSAPAAGGEEPAAKKVVVEPEEEIEEIDTEETVEKGEVKEFTVEGSNMKFAPSELSVNKGDTVRITFKNVEGMHDFVIDEFQAKTKQIQGGSEEVVEFVADKVGTFEYYCSVNSHRKLGMKGSLIVK